MHCIMLLANPCEAITDKKVDEETMWPWLRQPMLPPRSLPSDFPSPQPANYEIAFSSEVWKSLESLLLTFLGRIDARK